MEISASYTALEAMIQQGWIMRSIAEFENLLDLLEEKKLITSSEHRALLALARELDNNRLADP
jgi:hypothetical protein